MDGFRPAAFDALVVVHSFNRGWKRDNQLVPLFQNGLPTSKLIFITARLPASIGDEGTSGAHALELGSSIVCARCVEIDDRTKRYQELASAIIDKAALESIDRLIKSLDAEKLGLHPEPEQ